MKLLVLTLLVCTGCGTFSLRPVQRDHAKRIAEVKERLGVDDAHLGGMLATEQAECDALDNKATGWVATTIVAGVLGGGSGLTSVFTNDTPRYVVTGTGIALAAVSALSAYMGSHYAQRYSRECAVNVGGR